MRVGYEIGEAGRRGEWRERFGKEVRKMSSGLGKKRLPPENMFMVRFDDHTFGC